MISWPGRSSRAAFTSATILRIASPPLPRSTGMQPSLRAYQPTIGAQRSSFFMMNFGRGTTETIRMMSKKLWCLAAITTSSLGISPRISDLSPTRVAADALTQRV